MIEVKMEQSKDKWKFFVTEGEELIAEVIATPHEDKAVIHNDIHRWSKSLLSTYREIFADIRGVLRENGIRLIITCSDQFDKKMEKFWRLMGFEIFGEETIKGVHVNLAVMEA